MTTYYVKKGDTGSVTPKTFLEKGDGSAVDLTGATVRFLMRAPGAITPKVAAAAAIIGPATTGQVQYVWAANDLDTPGYYQSEYEVTYSGGAKETFPADGFIAVIVRDDLDT